MSNLQQNSSETVKNSSGDERKEQKVIVLSIKDMPSFKMKDLYGAPDERQSIFNFKPQQLMQSPSGSSIPLQVTQQQTQAKINANIQVQSMATPVQKIISTTPTQYVIRTQQAIPTPIAPKTITKPQFTLLVTPTGAKAHDDAPKLISSQVTIQNKLPEYQTVKSQATSLQAQAKKVVASPSQVLLNPQQKSVQVLQNVSKPAVPVPQATYKVIQKDIRQFPLIQPTIINQQPSQILIKTQPSSVPPQQSAWKTKFITLQPKVSQQKIAGSPIVFSQPQLPALTPIQRKILAPPTLTSTPISIPVEKPTVEMTMESEKEEEFDEMSSQDTSESQNEDFLSVKRIIEGDDDLNSFANNDAENGTKLNEEEKIALEEEEEMEDKCSEVITSQSEILNDQQAALSSDSLLCDEQISSISLEVSPNDKNNEEASSATPTQQNSEINYKSMATDNVKKTLNLDIATSGGEEKIQLRIEVEEEDDSVISDDTNISMLKNTTADNDDDSLHSKSELSLVASGEKKSSKRNRKTKNPTVNPNLGLPYKPQATNNRKKKAEKKMELEHDFHDPLNKILWEDGIGGLNNCYKLFGFDDFGLVEVISKKDTNALISRAGESVESNFKFKKILNPEDQFVCVVCSKMGTIRDFFSPECCSEACLAITKRKSYEHGGQNEQHDSGQSSPSTETKKVMLDGEFITIQQLQNHVIQQSLPGGKRRYENIKPLAVSMSSEDSFSWSSYLNSKSVPAPPELFKNHRQQQTSNPFKVGMKLEAIDPKNQNLFCVCTVEERLGHRIKLHFDGYPSMFDFWVDAGSKNIFPIDFCRNTKRKLHLPPRWPNKNFDWSEYLDAQNCAGAQRSMFPHLIKKEENCSAAIGMKLEVLKDDAWYAATISDIVGDRVLIKFDGQYEANGYAWFDFNSPYIGPCDGHKSDEEITAFCPPTGPPLVFSWQDYLKETKSEAVPDSFFANYEPSKNEFEPGMKLEVVDKINPQLIRPATILSRDDYKIQINFDGFDISYAYWLDCDSDEIYPINYCKQTGHPIEHPAGLSVNYGDLCSTPGCRGLGNGIHPDQNFHEKHSECPYSSINWKKLSEEKSRNRLEVKNPPANKRPLKVQKENKRTEKRQSLLKTKKEIKQEILPEVDHIEESYEETPSEKMNIQKRQRKRKAPAESESDSVPSVKIRINEDFLRGYGPQLNYSYKLWQENSKVLNRASVIADDLSENPLKWNIDDVVTFMLKLCDDETAAKFYAQQIDGEALLSLCQNDLVAHMNIKLGPSIKIYNRIMHLRQEVVTKFIKI